MVFIGSILFRLNEFADEQFDPFLDVVGLDELDSLYIEPKGLQFITLLLKLKTSLKQCSGSG